MKKTKRKAFNFLRSYFDVLNELKEDSDKLSFLTSIINKQFLNEDPKDLGFIANLCYESQRHSIESSVKGWIRVANTNLEGNPMTDPMTHPPTNPKEVEEKEKEEVQVEVEEKVKEQNKTKVYDKSVHDCLEICLQFFPKHLHPKNNDGLDVIEKLNRIEEIPFNIIQQIVKKTREDDFWSKNFLSMNKLRKKDKDGLMYILVFNERINGSTKKHNGTRRFTAQGAIDAMAASGLDVSGLKSDN